MLHGQRTANSYQPHTLCTAVRLLCGNTQTAVRLRRIGFAATGAITAGKMTYDLRRLRAHGLIERIPHTRRHIVTDTGLHHALLFTHAHDNRLGRHGADDRARRSTNAIPVGTGAAGAAAVIGA